MQTVVIIGVISIVVNIVGLFLVVRKMLGHKLVAIDFVLLSMYFFFMSFLVIHMHISLNSVDCTNINMMIFQEVIILLFVVCAIPGSSWMFHKLKSYSGI